MWYFSHNSVLINSRAGQKTQTDKRCHWLCSFFSHPVPSIESYWSLVPGKLLIYIMDVANSEKNNNNYNEILYLLCFFPKSKQRTKAEMRMYTKNSSKIKKKRLSGSGSIIKTANIPVFPCSPSNFQIHFSIIIVDLFLTT